MIDIYESAVDREGVFGCVFERDDDTAYFYLSEISGGEYRVIMAFNAHPVTTMPVDIPISVRFNSLDNMVGLVIGDDVLVVYDLTDRTNPRARWATEDDRGIFASN